MKNSARLTLSIITALLCANFGGPETSVSNTRKNKVNFFGTLTTQQGQTISVENISIAYLFKQIPVYDALLKTSQRVDYVPKKVNNDQENSSLKKYVLPQDPRKGIITKIDLANCAEIRTINPEEVWVFKRKKGYHPIEYIEIEIISNDSTKTRNSYLIETSRKLICDEINEAGPIEKEVPLAAVKTLKIEGYNLVEAEKIKNKKKETRSVAV